MDDDAVLSGDLRGSDQPAGADISLLEGVGSSHLLHDSTERGDRNMRLTTTTNVSVDGVMQGLGGPDEDRSGGFDRGGWAIPLVDAETGDYLNQIYGGASAFLFGRRTYEIFAGYWGAMEDPSTNPIAAALNGRPKYVASTSLTDPKWAGTTVLTGDVAAAIGELKTQHDGELLVPGSGVLVRWLLANDLVDQLDLLTYPVVVGQGTRLFPDSGPDVALKLVNSRTTSGGITIQTYRPVGRPEYATSTLDPKDVF
jgi:dihydrofolate reductase